MSNLDKVREFHLACDLPVNTGLISELRARLIKEEAEEVMEALILGDVKGLAKELCDLEYVLLGAILEGGPDWENPRQTLYTYDGSSFSDFRKCVDTFIYAKMTELDVSIIRGAVLKVFHCFFPDKDFDTAFAEVHRSNMSKFVDGKCLRREDGKILKGPNFSPADMSFMVPGLEELKRMPEYLNPEK